MFFRFGACDSVPAVLIFCKRHWCSIKNSAADTRVPFTLNKNFGALKSCQRRLSCKQTNSPGFCRMRVSLFLTFAEKNTYPRAATSIFSDLALSILSVFECQRFLKKNFGKKQHVTVVIGAP